MIAALELTPRQTARALEQAVRARAKLEIEPRPASCPQLLWGSVESQQNGVLHVNLMSGGGEPLTAPLAALIGAYCDVRTILSGQLYLFTTCIVDAVENAVPRRLVLAAPTEMQCANRRRFVRFAPLEPLPVQLHFAGASEPLAGEIINIGATGLACRVDRVDGDDRLLIGEAIKVGFYLPWAGESYDLDAIVCNKSRSFDGRQLIAGIEFKESAGSDGLSRMLERLRVTLSQATDALIESEGCT